MANVRNGSVSAEDMFSLAIAAVMMIVCNSEREHVFDTCLSPVSDWLARLATLAARHQDHLGMLKSSTHIVPFTMN